MSRRLLALCSVLMVLGVFASAAPSYAVIPDRDEEQGTPSPSQASGLFSAVSAGTTKADLLGDDADAGPGIYIVQLDAAPLALYNGELAGLRATSPSATGDAKLDASSDASQAYLRYLDGQRNQVLGAVERIVGDTVTPSQVYRYGLNGFAATLTPEQAVRVAELPSVVHIERDTLLQLDTDAGPAFIGAAQPDQRPGLFASDLSAIQETTPTTGTISSTLGRGVVTYNAASKTLSFQLSYQDLTGAPTMAHFHVGAPGVAGPVVLDIFNTAVGTPGTSGAFIGNKTIVAAAGRTADEIEAALFAGNLYFNIHTPRNPAGEIRGQVLANRGEGVVVGVIDGGINVGNSPFVDVGADGYDHTNPRGAGNYLGVCSNSDADGRFDPTFQCNDKLIGAYTFDATAGVNDPQGLPSPRDDDGHGSHTASTAAGNVVASTTVNGANTGSISGVAPHANIIAYDACGIPTSLTSCPNSATLAATDQAIADGVDVFNRSISSGGPSPWSELSALLHLKAIAAGVGPVVSGGNEGPNPQTVIGTVAGAPWTLAVAASTHNRVFVNSVGDFAGGDASKRPAAPLVGKGVTPGLGLTPIVYAGDVGIVNPTCEPFTNAQKPLVVGKIVICDRGGTAGRVAKADNVAAAGGVGFVLANNQANGNSLVGDAFAIPGVHITYNDGVALKAWVTGCSDCQASISGASRDLDNSYADVVASFSSRGPTATAPDVLKPDLAAPGVDILASDSDQTAGVDDYHFLSGTSMASPHVAGAVALLRQLQPDWTFTEIKSALMTTATSEMVKENGVTASDPFDRGAGRVRVDLAARAGLVLDETYEGFLAADPAGDGDPTSLNLPSIADSACVVTCSFVRTVRSTLKVPVSWSATTVVTTGLALTAQPSSFTLQPGATQTITFTADVSGATLNKYLFGSISLAAQGNLVPAASLPVAINPTPSDLPARIEIEGLTLNGKGSLTQPARAIAVSSLSVDVYGLVKATPQNVTLAQDATPATPGDPAGGGTFTTTVTLPVGTTRFHVRTANTTANDLDLYVFLDANNDNTPQTAERVCTSATGAADEFCDILAANLSTGLTAPVVLKVLVQNYEGSTPGPDTFTLYTGVVGTTATGNLTVTGPTSVPAGQPFELTLSWNLGADAKNGDLYVGLIRSGSSAATKGDLGYTLIDLLANATSTNLPFVPNGAAQ